MQFKVCAARYRCDTTHTHTVFMAWTGNINSLRLCPFRRRLCVSWLGPNGGWQSALQSRCLRPDWAESNHWWSNWNDLNHETTGWVCVRVFACISHEKPTYSNLKCNCSVLLLCSCGLWVCVSHTFSHFLLFQPPGNPIHLRAPRGNVKYISQRQFWLGAPSKVPKPQNHSAPHWN